MELPRESWIVRWAYLGSQYVPERTSLCALFWRVVLVTPLLISAFITLCGALAFMVYRHPQPAAAVVGVAAMTAICLLGGAALHDWREGKKDKPERPSVIRDGYRAIKRKVCPIVTLTDRRA